jgi:dsRNA-specific ribonuclease
VVSVEVKGKEPVEGTGKSKRAAEQDAASAFLKREGIRT